VLGTILLLSLLLVYLVLTMAALLLTLVLIHKLPAIEDDNRTALIEAVRPRLHPRR
jgi:hypothetical protein